MLRPIAVTDCFLLEPPKRSTMRALCADFTKELLRGRFGAIWGELVKSPERIVSGVESL